MDELKNCKEFMNYYCKDDDGNFICSNCTLCTECDHCHVRELLKDLEEKKKIKMNLNNCMDITKKIENKYIELYSLFEEFEEQYGEKLEWLDDEPFAPGFVIAVNAIMEKLYNAKEEDLQVEL